MKKIVIDKDSKGTIASYWAISLVLAIAAILLIKPLWILIPILVFLAVFAFFVFWFHRVPEREIPEGDDSLVTAVADGKIVVVGKALEPEYFKEERMQVSIYMNFFDVHVNFWPITGEVSYYKYHPGKYLLAFHPKVDANMTVFITICGISLIQSYDCRISAKRIRTIFACDHISAGRNDTTRL